MNATEITLLGHGAKAVTLKGDVFADDVEGAMRAVAEEMNNRDIPFDDDKRVGLFGDPSIEDGERFGMMWNCDARLQPGIVVGYHLDAIVPPALVLQPQAIVYGFVSSPTHQQSGDREGGPANIESLT